MTGSWPKAGEFERQGKILEQAFGTSHWVLRRVHLSIFRARVQKPKTTDTKTGEEQTKNRKDKICEG